MTLEFARNIAHATITKLLLYSTWHTIYDPYCNASIGLHQCAALQAVSFGAWKIEGGSDTSIYTHQVLQRVVGNFVFRPPMHIPFGTVQRQNLNPDDSKQPR